MWDKRYSGKSYAYGTNPNDFLRDQADILTEGDTLCLGEGEGRNAVFLAGIAHRVTALDASNKGLEKARNLAAENDVEITTLHADLAKYEFETSRWDTIVSIYCHLPPPIRLRVHNQIARSLRPGGQFILEAFTPRQLEFKTGGPPVAEMMMNLDQLRSELNGLTFDIGRETIREVQEGEFHNGTSAVVQIVARKAK